MQFLNQPVIYSDLNQDTPTSEALVKYVDSIYQSITNIMTTRKGERVFNPNFGIDVEDYIFEIIDFITSNALFREITTAIEEYEQRVTIDYSRSIVEPLEELNSYYILLIYTIEGLDGQEFSTAGQLVRSDAS